MSTISSVVIVAFMEGTFRGEAAIASGTSANVRPSFLLISTLPDFSA
jgi:hypothetical protein